MLLFKFILDDWSGKKSFKGIQEFEFSNDGITVIKALGKDRGKSSLKTFDSLSKLVEIIIEHSLFNVHNVVFDLHELIDSNGEFIINLENTSSKSLTFSVTNLNSIKLIEFDDGLGQLHKILASL